MRPDRDEGRDAAVLGGEHLLDPDDLRPLEEPVLQEPGVRVELGQVVAAGVGEDHDHSGGLGKLPGNGERRVQRRPRRTADEDPFGAGDGPGGQE